MLLADTVIALSPNSGQTFRFAYSESLGLQGFISSPGAVGEDTMAFQILNNLTDYYTTTYPQGIDFHIAFYNSMTATYDETGIVIEDFMKVKLFPTSFQLPLTQPSGLLYIYLGRIVDRATGEFIAIPGSGRTYFRLPYGTSGYNYIFNLGDDGTGFITISNIQL